MEMGMDKAVSVDKPENDSLPFNWSAGMMGMMTLARVLPDEKYNQILEMKTSGAHSTPGSPPHKEHPHG